MLVSGAYFENLQQATQLVGRHRSNIDGGSIQRVIRDGFGMEIVVRLRVAFGGDARSAR
jgi:hypothetical protein